MSNFYDFINTLFIGALTATVYFISRDIEKLNYRIEELEEEQDLWIDEQEDEEDEAEEETEEGEIKPVQE
jgi:hypothetical protein